ncbi:hypothetical protein, partial [Ignavibacterium sp.]|uniref:hypothetical protein n=1 Tax=Ignavibacterium sp. TaxID=2651167 RepID=UPI0025BBDC4D
MEKQSDYAENFDESSEHLPEGVSPEEINILISMEENSGSGDSGNDYDDEQIENNIEYVNAEEVSKEIEKIFKEDPQLMVKLIKVAEAFIYGHRESYHINGLGAQDIVMDSIEAILSLKRKWYKSKCPNIVVLLIGVCKSKIRNFINGKDHKDQNKVIPLYPKDEENKNGNNIYDDEQGKKYNSFDQKSEEFGEEFFQK